MLVLYDASSASLNGHPVVYASAQCLIMMDSALDIC